MGSGNDVDEPSYIDPLQGEEKRVLNAFSKGVDEIIDAFNSGTLKNEEQWYNLKWMQKHIL